MPRPKKKPTWWRDPAVQAVVRRGLLYLIRNIYGEIPSCVKVCLKQKAEKAVFRNQNKRKGRKTRSFKSEVEYYGAFQGIYNEAYDNSGDLSTANGSQNIKSRLEAETSETSTKYAPGESVQDDSDISHSSAKKCLIQLLRQLYPEVANCLSQTDHTSSAHSEDLCACISAIVEVIETSETDVDLKDCLLQLIEQLCPELTCIENNNANESVPPEEIENVEETEGDFDNGENNAEDTVNDEGEQSIHGDYIDETGVFEEFNEYLTAEEIAPERAINNVVTEDSHDSLEECLMELVQQICPQLARCIDQSNKNVLESIESGEECDYEERNEDENEEEIIDENAESNEEEVVEGDETHEATTDSLRDCLVELIQQLYPKMTNRVNQNGDRIGEPTANIPELTAYNKQPPGVYDNSKEEGKILEEENAEEDEVEEVQEDQESTNGITDESHEDNNGDFEFNKRIRENCLLQFIQKLYSEMINCGDEGTKPGGEINEESRVEEYYNEGELSVEDEQNYEGVQSEYGGVESDSNEDSLKECLIQLIQQLYPEVTIYIDDSEKSEFEKYEIEESESTKIPICEGNQGEEEIPSEWNEETLRNCFLSFVEQMYPGYIQQSAGNEFNKDEENYIDLEGNLEVNTMDEIREPDESERTISENYSNEISSHTESPEDSKIETTKEDEENGGSGPEFGEGKLKECLLQLIQQLYPDLADCIRRIEDCKPQDSEGTQTEVSTFDESTETDSDFKDHMLQFFEKVDLELANSVKQARNPECNGFEDGKESECMEETLRKCFLDFVEQLYPGLANCVKETTGKISTSMERTTNEKGEKITATEECGDVGEITTKEKFPVNKYSERSEGEQNYTQVISDDEEVEDKSSCEDGIEEVSEESQNSEKSEVNNGADTECNDENIKEELLQLTQKLYPDLAKYIRKYESGKMSDSEESDVMELTMNERDLRESLSLFIDRNCPDLANCFKLNNDVDPVSSDGSDTESECNEETVKNRFLKFVEEFYPDLAICIKQCLREIPETTENVNKEEGEFKAEESGISEIVIIDETNTHEKESKEDNEQSESVDILYRVESDKQYESDDTITDRTSEISQEATHKDGKQESVITDENKTECSDNSLRECLMQFIQQICPELSDCIKQYNDSNSSSDENSDVSISEVSEALEASSSEGDIKDCLLKFIELLYPDLAKCIRESDISRKPYISEGSVVDITEGMESTFSENSLRDCLINFFEKVCPELADCIRHVKTLINDDGNAEKESKIGEINMDETTIDESILDEVKIEQIFNENNDEDSQTEVLTISELHESEGTTVFDHFDDEEKSEMTIIPDQFKRQSEVTVTDDADSKTEVQSVDLSQDISVTEYIQPLVSSNQTQIDDEETLSSEDIFEDCFLRIVEHFNPDLACRIMQNLPEYLTPQIEDSNESGDAVSEQPNESQENSEDLSKMEVGLVREVTVVGENNTNWENSDSEYPPRSQELTEKSDDLVTEENSSMVSEIVQIVENSNSEYPGAIRKSACDLADENLSMVSEVVVSENLDNSIEGSALNEEVSAADKTEEISSAEDLTYDNSRLEENLDQNTRVSGAVIQLKDERQAAQQNPSEKISCGTKNSNISIIERKVKRGIVFNSLFDEISHIADIVEESDEEENEDSKSLQMKKGEGGFGKEGSKFNEDSEIVQEEGDESTTESSVDGVDENDVPSSEYQESDGNVESPVVEENTGSEAENREWTESMFVRDPGHVKRHYNIRYIGSEDKFMEEPERVKNKTEMAESEVSLDNVSKDKFSIVDSATESVVSVTSEENDDDLDELRGCLLAIADEFHPELANCIRKCLAEEEEEGMVSDSETDRRNMQLCLENFAAKFYAKPSLNPEQDISVPGMRNVEEMPTPTVKYIQQLILDFAQIFHPKLADSLQQQ
ncbi:unnamed protein product [Hymenolepis diminuta]|uniref:BEN domain-containing protein n=1 Tax=Hymenolepis diminuta TaxID=6216 RepID=A0A0R3SUB9_HYMDI|nr:unnamed protein product [Hymenolepis diminuta]VUZ43068.1 unnamed protein product [Hymenolepis diminuta]